MTIGLLLRTEAFGLVLGWECYLKTLELNLNPEVPVVKSLNARNQQTFDRSKIGKSELFQKVRFRHKGSHKIYVDINLKKHWTSKI